MAIYIVMIGDRSRESNKASSLIHLPTNRGSKGSKSKDRERSKGSKVPKEVSTLCKLARDYRKATSKHPYRRANLASATEVGN